MAMTIMTRLMSGRTSGRAPLETLERPTTVVGGGSAIILNMRTASTVSMATSWLQFTVRTSGSRKTSATGRPAASAAGSSASMAMPARPSAVVGMPSTPIVRAITLAPYLAASCMTLSRRSGSADAELSMAGCLQTLRPASMAARFVVSSESGTSATSCTAWTIHGMISWPSFFCGPMLRSTMPAPASTWRTAISWMVLGVAGLDGRLHRRRDDVDVLTDDEHRRPPSPGVWRARRRRRLERRAQRAVGRQVDERPAGGVELRDQRVVRQDGEQLEAVLGDRRLELGREPWAARFTIEVVPPHLGLELADQRGDASRPS